MKKHIVLVVGLGLLLGAQSCKKDKAEPEPEPAPTPISAKYNNDVKNIMNNYCTACHSGANPSSNLSLTTYAEVKAAAQNRGLYTRMNSSANPMPASGKLSTDKLAIVDKWIQDGYPEN